MLLQPSGSQSGVGGHAGQSHAMLATHALLLSGSQSSSLDPSVVVTFSCFAIGRMTQWGLRARVPARQRAQDPPSARASGQRGALRK
jgi:hypothetical protein